MAELVAPSQCWWSCCSAGGPIALSVATWQSWWPHRSAGGPIAVSVAPSQCQWSRCSAGGPIALSVATRQSWWPHRSAGGPVTVPVAPPQHASTSRSLLPRAGESTERRTHFCCHFYRDALSVAQSSCGGEAGRRPPSLCHGLQLCPPRRWLREARAGRWGARGQLAGTPCLTWPKDAAVTCLGAPPHRSPAPAQHRGRPACPEVPRGTALGSADLSRAPPVPTPSSSAAPRAVPSSAESEPSSASGTGSGTTRRRNADRGAGLWVTLLGQGVGLGDPQRSPPTPTIL